MLVKEHVMYKVQNQWDHSYLNSCGFAGPGRAWNENEGGAEFEDAISAYRHAEECGVLGQIRIEETDDETGKISFVPLGEIAAEIMSGN